MSDSHAPHEGTSPPRGDGVPPAPPKPVVMRLPTWVVVVLLLTLVASCSAASTAGGSIVSNEGSSNGASEADVRDLCRLLGSVATAQGVDLDEVFTDGVDASECSTAARESSGP